jgi:hypothetical protein
MRPTPPDLDLLVAVRDAELDEFARDWRAWLRASRRL